MARVRPGWTGQVLWTGPAGATAAHAALPWLVVPRKHQPRQEEEAQARAQWWRYPTPLSFPFLSFLYCSFYIFGLFYWTVFTSFSLSLLLFSFLRPFLPHPIAARFRDTVPFISVGFRFQWRFYILIKKCNISCWLTVYGTVSLCVPFYNIFASFKGCLLAVACFKFFSSSSTYFDFDFSTVDISSTCPFHSLYLEYILLIYIRLFLFCYETFSCGGWLAYLIKVIFYFRLIFLL